MRHRGVGGISLDLTRNIFKALVYKRIKKKIFKTFGLKSGDKLPLNETFVD
jgi:hypothetical protein